MRNTMNFTTIYTNKVKKPDATNKLHQHVRERVPFIHRSENQLNQLNETINRHFKSCRLKPTHDAMVEMLEELKYKSDKEDQMFDELLAEFKAFGHTISVPAFVKLLIDIAEQFPELKDIINIRLDGIECHIVFSVLDKRTPAIKPLLMNVVKSAMKNTSFQRLHKPFMITSACGSSSYACVCDGYRIYSPKDASVLGECEEMESGGFADTLNGSIKIASYASDESPVTWQMVEIAMQLAKLYNVEIPIICIKSDLGRLHFNPKYLLDTLACSGENPKVKMDKQSIAIHGDRAFTYLLCICVKEDQ